MLSNPPTARPKTRPDPSTDRREVESGEPLTPIVAVHRTGDRLPGRPLGTHLGKTTTGAIRRRDARRRHLHNVVRTAQPRQRHAKSAAALILISTDEGDDEDSARYAALDAGSAMENLLIEAFSGTCGRIRWPVSTPTARAAFDITDLVRPLVVVAIGPLANYDVVPDDVAERDSAPRKRLPLEEIVLNWPVQPGT